jgi:hypothetical protein
VLLERAQRIAIVGGHEDHDRHRVGPELSEDFEAVHFGHLDIEEQHIRLLLAHALDGFCAVAAVRNDDKIGLC